MTSSFHPIVHSFYDSSHSSRLHCAHRDCPGQSFPPIPGLLLHIYLVGEVRGQRAPSTVSLLPTLSRGFTGTDSTLVPGNIWVNSNKKDDVCKYLPRLSKQSK